MRNLQLITGNKTYSASSLRAYLCLREFSLDFVEIKIDLFKSNSAEQLALYSPSLQVPVLIDGEIKVWDSLAICEYVSDTFLQGQGWPTPQKKRAAARSIATELHADFQYFKQHWPMDCQHKSFEQPNESLEQEIARLDAIIYCCRRQYSDGGQFVFGKFTIVDCMLAPFAITLQSYNARVSRKTQHYLTTLLNNPHMKYWGKQSLLEQGNTIWEKSA